VDRERRGWVVADDARQAEGARLDHFAARADADPQRRQLPRQRTGEEDFAGLGSAVLRAGLSLPAEIETIVTALPPPRSFMCGAAARIDRTA